MKKIVALLLSVVFIFATAGCVADDSPDITLADPWVRSSDASVVGGMSGAFMKLTNNSDQVVTLVGGSSNVAGMVEIHETVMAAEGMQMQEIGAGLQIPAGQTITLQPGGMHVMLMNLSQDIAAGDLVEITLNFDGGDTQTMFFTATAKPSEAGDEQYHSDDMELTQ